MARITVEDCLENITNRFVLVRLTAKRSKQILAGDTAVTDSKGNKYVVTALREIADGKVRFATEEVEGSEEELAIEEVLEATTAEIATPEAS